MATNSAIRAAIGAQLAAVPLLRVQDEFGETPPVSAQASVAVVQYAGVTFDAAFGGQGHARLFGVIVLVGRIADRVAIDRMDAFSDDDGDSSIRAAVNGTLGGVVADARVATGSEYKDYPIGEASYVGVEFVVQVMT